MWPVLLAAALAASEGAPRGALALRDWDPIGPESAWVEEIVADPRDARVAYAIAGSLLWRTRDGGRFWFRLAQDLPSQYFDSLAMDESAPDTLYVSTADALLRSENGGDTWSPRGIGLPNGVAFGTSVSAARPSRVYALNGGALFRSDNRGDRWFPVPDGTWPADAPIVWVRPDPLADDTVYAGVEGQRIFRSRDAGTHWSPIGLTTGFWPIVIDPTNSRVMYAQGFKSTDGGERWSPLPVFGNPTAIGPATPSTVYVGAEEGGLYRTRDAGATWELVGGGLPSRIQALALSLADSSIVYAGTFFDGVLRSEDGGESWVAANGGFPAMAIGSLAVDPVAGWLYAGPIARPIARLFKRSVHGGDWIQTPAPGIGGLFASTYVSIDPTQPNALYASGGSCGFRPLTCGGGVSRTTDGGATWELLSGGTMNAIVVDLASPPILYSVESTAVPDPNFPTIGRVVQTSVRSLDGGERWVEMDVPPGEFAVDPTRPGTLFAATASEGVWKSADSGASWAPSSDGLADPATHSVAVSGGTIYVGTDRGVDASSDGGAHWSPTGLSDLAFSLVTDPGSPGSVYAGTDTGVFRIGADGTSVRIGPEVPNVRALAVHGLRIWAATFTGVFEYDLGRPRPPIVPR